MLQTTTAASPATARREALTRSLPQQIASHLAERIIAGAWEPGRRIMEQALAAEFGVSRGPVREALRLLEKDGLAVIHPWRGAQVTRLSADEVRDLFDIRSVLLGLAAQLLAAHAGRQARLPAIAAQCDEVLRCARGNAGVDRYLAAVYGLGDLIIAGSGNARLLATLHSFGRQTTRYSRLGLASSVRRRRSAQNWQALVRALRRGDPPSAETIARRIILESRDAAIEALARAPGRLQ